MELQCSPGCWELGGHLVMLSQLDYERVTEDMADRLLEHASLDHDQFQEVLAMCLDKAGCGVAGP